VVLEFKQMLAQPEVEPFSEPPPPPPTPTQLAAYRPPSEVEIPLPEQRELPPLPSDPVRALELLPLDVLVVVLGDEQANTIALVLNTLPGEKAGEILRELSPDMRREVSVRLSRLTTPSPALLSRIAGALVKKARALAGKPSDSSGDARYEKMADMLRCLEKTERMEVLTALEENEPDTARRIRELLYTFEDLLRIHDRSMQRLLAEIEAKTLSLALKGANQAITEKVQKNLSKRAREALTEEMEFLGMVPIAQVREAQKALVEVIQRLDQSGELMMDE
jgi:flagellar motor switch protein FliG